MANSCACPVGAHIGDLGNSSCRSSFGQTQKLIFMRRQSAAGTDNEIDEDDLKSKTAMTALLTSATGTKVVVSPFVQNPVTEPGAARTYGSGNQVLGGVPIVVGTDPTKFTGVFLEEDQALIKVLKTYACEDMAVMLVNENGDIMARKYTTTSSSGGSSTTTVTYKPFPIRSLFIGDKKLGGFEEPDSNAVEFNFEPNWSDDAGVLKQSEMDYNPLTDLSNQASAS